MSSTRPIQSQRRGRSAERLNANVAVGYCRRSTDRQEQSIPDQKRAIERYCRDQGLTLLRWYVDDAISGTATGKRSRIPRVYGD